MYVVAVSYDLYSKTKQKKRGVFRLNGFTPAVDITLYSGPYLKGLGGTQTPQAAGCGLIQIISKNYISHYNLAL